MKKKTLTILLILFYGFFLFSQTPNTIHGLILDSHTEKPLPYANIVVLHKKTGTISNESGYFSINTVNLNPNDTLSIQYIGYKTLNIILSKIDSNATIHLKEDIINLSETLIFSDPPEARFIVKQILNHKEENYKVYSAKRQCFIRRRLISDINKMKIKLKRNDIPKINKKLLKTFEEKIPKHNISYTDLLGTIYFSKNFLDSIKLKPIKTVSLKEKEVTDLDEFEKIFNNLFSNTKEKEYWKIKTGIFSQKINIESDDEKDTITSEKDPHSFKNKTHYYNETIKEQLKYTSFENNDEWEFLHKTNKYNYTLIGGTSISGEDVYIIDFSPKKSGVYYGRMFVSINNFALIRADYEYEKGKLGSNFNILGVGYAVNHFSGSVFFEKRNNNYILKYFSKKESTRLSFERNISLIKKRERFLFDKELFEVKVKMNFAVNNQESFELLFLNEKPITEQDFRNSKEPKEIKITLVNKFDEQLWKDYPIIEPTQNMKEYQKKE